MSSIRLSLTVLVMTFLLTAVSYPQRNPSGQAQPSRSVLGPVGTVWGGDHLRLEVTADGANLEFDCASGAITAPLSIDPQGKFRATGMFTRERPGPVMRDSPGASQATYTGTVQGDTMHLVVASGSAEPYGEYVLTRGKSGRVVKCR